MQVCVFVNMYFCLVDMYRYWQFTSNKMQSLVCQCNFACLEIGILAGCSSISASAALSALQQNRSRSIVFIFSITANTFDMLSTSCPPACHLVDFRRLCTPHHNALLIWPNIFVTRLMQLLSLLTGILLVSKRFMLL